MYDLNTHTLTASSPHAAQPQGAKVQLRPHQLTLLHRAVELENGPVELPETPDGSNKTLDTMIGVLGDCVGSGKSYVVLGMVLADRLNGNMNERPMTTIMGDSHMIVTHRADRSAVSRATLLVIPHNISMQWERYIRQFSDDIKYAMITRSKQLAECNVPDVFATRELIVVTNTFYAQMASALARANILVRRVVYDEADSISIASAMRVGGLFTWFVTASYGNLMYPRGYRTVDRSTGEVILLATGIKNKGFIHRIFNDIHDCAVKRLIVVRNSDAFINESIQLPAVVTNIVRCRTPVSINMLQGYVERAVMEMLNAGDVSGAISALDPSRKTTHENIVDACISRYQCCLDQLRAELPAKVQLRDLMIDADQPSERWANEVTRTQTKIAEYEQRIAGIRSRLQDGEDGRTCHICWDTISNQCVVPCCAVSFCFECLMRWIHTAHNCPMCKRQLSTADIMVRDVQSESSACVPAQQLDKVQTLMSVLDRAPAEAKFLVFSAYENTFERVASTLRRAGVSFAFLKGNVMQVRSIVTGYQSGAVRVLLVNSRNYGSGLDLSMTTDVVMMHKFDNEIEHQVIGRAQRVGRVSALNLWYLLHENECNQLDAGNTSSNFRTPLQ